MKMNGSFALRTSTNARLLLFQKVLFASLIIALLVASFSVSSVLAARSNPRHEELEQAWNHKLRVLSMEMAIFNQMQVLPSQIEGCSKSEQALILAGTAPTTNQQSQGTNTTTGQQVQAGTGNISKASCFFKWQQAQNRLERYRSILGQAQALLVNSGFDANGFVIDQKQARKSVDTLGGFLTTLRNIRQNLGASK